MSNRRKTSRRTVLQTVGSLGATTVAGTAAGTRDHSDEDPATARTRRSFTDVSKTATTYIAVVDRIVDDSHVVLLLEDCDAVVDQLVVSVDRFDHIAERDVLLAFVEDGELLLYHHLPSKPSCSGSDLDSDRLRPQG